MKKLFNFSLAISILSILFLFGFAIVKSAQGEHVTAYWRFYESDSVGKRPYFNWFSTVFSPQVESQRVYKDTILFTHRVKYPFAKKFQVVEPFDKNADTAIAKEIAKVIKDSIASIHYRLWGNIDNNSVRVRNYAQPKTIAAVRDSLSLFLFGTASPEAGKYGFIKSIQPGHREPENKRLAANRLSRTENILIRKLKADNITVTKIVSAKSDELQLTKEEVDSVAAGHLEILDRMRYVDASVKIITQRVVVTPVTAPILLPVWIYLLYLLSLIRFKRPEKEEEKTEEQRKPFNWARLFRIILGTLSIVAIVVLIYYFWDAIIVYLLVGVAFIVLALLVSLIVMYSNEIGRFFVWLWEALCALWLAIRRFFQRWWPRRWECQLVVILLLLSWLAIILMIIYWPHCKC